MTSLTRLLVESDSETERGGRGQRPGLGAASGSRGLRSVLQGEEFRGWMLGMARGMLRVTFIMHISPLKG